MKYQAYPEYKGSGVEWFDSAPKHWEIKKISYFALLRSGDAITSEQINTQGEYPVYGGNGLRGYTSNYNHDGDYILIGRQGALCGNINYAHGEFWASEHAVVVHPSMPINFKWFGETLRSMDLNQYNLSAAQPGLAVANITCLKVPFPPLEEQTHIANFLDHETTKIDTLIEKQQQLIKLLKEKRQAVISHAVTKGLTNLPGTNLNSGSAAGPKGEGTDSPSNPNAPMRDSGIEWLGEVPEHWDVNRFKFLCDRIIAGPFGSSITKDMYVKRGYKVYGQEQVIPNDFSIGDYYIEEKHYLELSRYITSSGDILISCVGTFGKIAVFPEDAEPGIINPRLIKAEINENCDPFYVRELLKSEMVFKQFELLSRGGTMGVINIGILSDILAAVPPLNEQGEIVAYINEQKSKFRNLIEQVNNAVLLLKERRAALISAAVTGKIDIRDRQEYV